MKKRECPLFLLLAIIFFSQNVKAFDQLTTVYWYRTRNYAQLLILLILVLYIVVKGYVNSRQLLIYLVFVSSIAFGVFVHNDFMGIFWILDCTRAFLLVTIFEEYSIAEKFEKIMFVVCGVYSGLYLVAICYLDILKTPIYTFLESTRLVWNHASLYEQYKNGTDSLRSYAFFREPGVYQMFIILAIVIELFVIEKFRWWHVGLYMFAILATRSTTGYMCLLLVMLMTALHFMKKNRKTILCIMGASAVGGILVPTMLGSILAKFTATGVQSHSWLSRLASVVTNIYFWKQSPFIGMGLSYINENFETVNRVVFGLQAGTLKIKDNTNTVLLFFAAYGTVVGIMFLIGTFGWCKAVAKSNLQTLILFVTLVFLYAGEAVNGTCYPYILFFMGMFYLGDNMHKKRVEAKE